MASLLCLCMPCHHHSQSPPLLLCLLSHRSFEREALRRSGSVEPPSHRSKAAPVVVATAGEQNGVTSSEKA